MEVDKLRHAEDQRRNNNGRAARGHAAQIAIFVSILGLLGGLSIFVMDLGAQKERIDTIKKRLAEDRSNTAQAIAKLDGKVESVNNNVNLILQEIRAMQAEQRVERRMQRNNGKGEH